MTILNDTLWPLLLLAPPLLYLCARLVLYFGLRLRGRELPFDQETHDRGASLLLGPSVRQVYAWSVQPLVRVLARRRVPPNLLTVMCLLFSIAAGVCIALGAVTLGGVVGLAGSSLDYFDGRTARSSGRVTRAGTFLDSTLDRYGEVAFFAGAALLFRGSALTLAACLLALGSGGVVSYARAKAEALGVPLASGLMQRPERVVMFCLGASGSTLLDRLLPAELQGQHLTFAVVLLALALLTTHTSCSRTARGFLALRRAEQERRTDER
jgi:CDP-diacylglycerol--glycerol-3-phosphate 3-phosphatidyltransferase